MGIRIAEFLRFGISLSPAYFLKLPSCYHQFSLLDSPRDDKGLAGKQRQSREFLEVLQERAKFDSMLDASFYSNLSFLLLLFTKMILPI